MRWNRARAPVLVEAPGHVGGRTRVGARNATLNNIISIHYTNNTASAVGKGAETGYGRLGVQNRWSSNILVNFNQYWPIRCYHVAVPDWSTSTPNQLPTHLPYFQLSWAVISILRRVAFRLVHTANWIATSSSVHDTCRILIGPYCHMFVCTTATSYVRTIWIPHVTLSVVPCHHVCTVRIPRVTLSMVPHGTSFCQFCLLNS